MVLEIFQLLMSDETHLKRLNRLEIYCVIGNSSLLEFLSPQQVIFPGKFPEIENLKGCHISSRISGNVDQSQAVSEATVAFTFICVTVIGTGHGATRARWRGH